jgi:hypothetical protein
MRILNLGAGVQSTALALMAKQGDIEPFDYAVFADTMAEPKKVYDHLKWLIDELTFPVLVRSRGNLTNNIKNGINNDGGRFCSLPFFTGDEGRNSGITRRQCTSEYKIKVVEKTIRYEILKLQPRQHIPKNMNIVQIMGLSYDEPTRIAKVKARHASNNWKVEFPLYDLEMTRTDCINWLKEYGVPHETPRSACTFCPYHSDAEWKRIKEQDPESWKQAVEVDRIIRDKSMRATQAYNDKLWLHRSCTPLDSVDFDKWKDARGQSYFGFSNECEGMCGV